MLHAAWPALCPRAQVQSRSGKDGKHEGFAVCAGGMAGKQGGMAGKQEKAFNVSAASREPQFT